MDSRLELRVDERDRFPAATAVDAEVSHVGCNDRMPGMKFTQANQTEVGEVWLAVGISRGQFHEPIEVFTYR